MDLSKALEGIEKLFLEILGYLLPGLPLLFLGFRLLPAVFHNMRIDVSQVGPWELVASGYVLGYVVYGLSLVKDELFQKVFLRFVQWLGKKLGKQKWTEKKMSRSRIEDAVSASLEVLVSRDILKKLLASSTPDINQHVDNLGLHSLRSLAMSYVPQSDRKVYTFMFRADLSDHVGTLALVFGFWGFIAYWQERLFGWGSLIVTLDFHVYFYAVLLVASYFFFKTKLRFLGIALSIPFSMFIATYYRLEEKKDG